MIIVFTSGAIYQSGALSQSAVTTTTSIIAVARGITAGATSEVVSKFSFEILSGRIGVVRAVSGVMA
jgi:hypothetical protein